MYVPWTLHDPSTDETFVLPRNPKQMTSPHPPRNSTIFAKAIGPGGHGVSRVLAFRKQPYEWSFSGAIRTQEHYDTFRAWVLKTGVLHVSDHLGRTWRIRFDRVDFDEKRATQLHPWRYDYTVHAMIYGQVS